MPGAPPTRTQSGLASAKPAPAAIASAAAARPNPASETRSGIRAAVSATRASSPQSRGTSHAFVSAWTAPKKPSSAAPASRARHGAAGSPCRRTRWSAVARKSSRIGIASTCACRSANVRLQNGYSLIVSLMTREVAQK